MKGFFGVVCSVCGWTFNPCYGCADKGGCKYTAYVATVAGMTVTVCKYCVADSVKKAA